MIPTLALPKESKILVTAANCYVGTHIVDVLLQLGYRVRGTVRSHKPWLDKYFKEKYGDDRFESVVVEEMEKDNAFDDTFAGISGVIHVASVVNFSADPAAVIPPTVRGAINALRAASKHPSVKQFVLTSSSSAATSPKLDAEYTVRTSTWNDFAVDAAWDPATPVAQRPYYVYAASKTEGEREAWNWFEQNKPNFTFNTVLPSVNFGKILIPEVSPTTMGMVRRILTHGDPGITYMPQYYVNVRDTARLHVAALLDPSVQSERIFAWVAEHNLTDIVGALRRLRPQNQMIKNAPENEGRDRAIAPSISRAEKLLKSFFGVDGWVGFEESIADGIEDLA